MLQQITALGSVNQMNTANKVATPVETNTSFKNALVKALETVNDYQLKSDEATQKLVNGENVNLHDVMISAQKASIVMQTAIEVRNKAVESYQEMMRMSI